MQLSDFDYALPETLIAHDPLVNRSDSRLMVVDRVSGAIQHQVFSDLPQLLSSNDALVFNDTRVIKARLSARRATGGEVEVFLVKPLPDSKWEALVNPMKRVRIGEQLQVTDDFLIVIHEKDTARGIAVVAILCKGDIFKKLEQVGKIPLPPYISHSKDDDVNRFESRYQTVFAEKPGAVAAPTASLHFTPDILQQLNAQGVMSTKLTLHVGMGTFQPVKVADIRDHKMHSEWYNMDKATAERLNGWQGSRRIIAVGTTVARTLESCYTDNHFESGSGETDIFIYPGHRIQAFNGLITNFHLPKSTLLMLVAAFAGSELIRHAYNEAIQNQYRFFSFGDAMLII